MARRSRSSQKSLLEISLADIIARMEVPEPVQQHMFHPTRKWRLDFAWPLQKIAAEIHGGIWTNGRHVRGGGFIGDREKMNECQLLGWIVLELTPETLNNGKARAFIRRAFQLRGWMFSEPEPVPPIPKKRKTKGKPLQTEMF